MNEEYEKWNGIITPLVGKNSKYAVRQWKGNWRVSIVMNTPTSVITLYSKDGEEVVRDINEFLNLKNLPLGGVFYINHNKDIIKPITVGSDVEYYYIGRYPNVKFSFSYRNNMIDNWRHNHLTLGDEYPYPPVGIQYQYSRPNMRITAKVVKRSKWTKEEIIYTLDDNETSKMLINLIFKATEQESGRFYVNEHGLVFKPIQTESGVGYKFITKLDFNSISWFDIQN